LFIVTYIEFLFPDFAEWTKNDGPEQKVGPGQIAGDVMQNRQNAIVDEWAVGLEILESRAVSIDYNFRTELSQVLANIKTPA
jgi:hypothetical protein